MSKTARWIFVICLAAFLGAAVWGLYHRFTSHITLRIAVGDNQPSSAALLKNLAQWLRANNKTTILELVPVASESEAEAAVTSGTADGGVVRADQPLAKDLASAMLLYSDAIVFLVPPGSTVKGWTDVNGKTVGLYAAMSENDPLLRRVLANQAISNVTFKPVSDETVNEMVTKKQVQLLAGLRPTVLLQNEEGRAKLRAFKAVKGKASILALEDAGVLAEADNRYSAFDIPAKTFGIAPPVPAEEVSTLAVAHHLVVKQTMHGLKLQKVLADFMAAKRGLSPTVPLIRQIGSPGDSADSMMPVHSAAMGYFAGDELSLIDMVMDWIYTVPMILGGIGAFLTWLYNALWPAERRRAQETMVDLLVLRREVAKAQNLDELGACQTRRDALQDDIDRELSASIGDKTVTALLVAADAVDRKLDQMERRLSTAKPL